MATVLVVDDVAANRDLVATLLGCRGHEVLEAHDGIEALAIAHGRHPDIVVSDVLMPGIDGLELVHRLRSDPDPATAGAPVIFYTASYLEPETRPIADAYGVSRVVLRGADPRELLDAVDEVLTSGPVDVHAGPDDDFALVHARAVNAKLVEKVRALGQSERKFEAVSAALSAGIALLDADGNVVYVNPRLSEITGRPASVLIAGGWLVCLESDVRPDVTAAIRGPVAGTVEHLYRTHLTRTDRSDRWLRVHLRQFFDAESALAGAVLMVDDISDVVDAAERAARETRQRHEEARQRDADRLDDLRRMAGGVAHDFNSPLGTMLGFLQLATEAITNEMTAGTLATPIASALLDDLGQATKSGQRAAKLTEQLSAFGRDEISEPTTVDLNGFIAAFARATDVDGVVLELRLAGDTPLVSIDRRALDRLLQILVRNACEAMPAGGTITISTAADPAAGAAGGSGASITLADTGTGMSPEVLRRAFEPFFSTKPGNRTAGLGLSTAHRTVTQAKGDISLSSPAGGGAAVGIRLPPAVSPLANPAPPGPATTARRLPAAACETTVLPEGRSLEPGRTIVAKPFSSAQLSAAVTATLAGGRKARIGRIDSR